MREFELKPSRRLGLLRLGMMGLALVAVWIAALPTEARLMLSGGVIGLVVLASRRAPFKDSVRLASDGRLRCQDQRGEWREAEVMGDSFVSTGLIVLRYRLPGGRVRTLTLLSDSASADDLRRLRVSLRWASHTRSGKAFPGAG